MPSAPSRFEVDHLYRLMLKASTEAAALDERLAHAREDDSLWPALQHWSDAAVALDETLERARPGLQRDGTPEEQIDRIHHRLRDLQQRTRKFDLDFDLEPCVEAWTALGHELAQLSGRQRDPLVHLLERHKPAIDQTTAMLSEAQRHEGLLQEQHRKVLQVTQERDRAREKLERLRQTWMGAQQHEVKKPPLPDLRRFTRDHAGPVVVRLPSTTQVEKTLSHLATAPHRTLTDGTVGELRARLAQIDSILSRLRGAGRKDVLEGAQAIGSILIRMHAMGARPGGPAHLTAFRKLIDERRAQLHRIAQAQLSSELTKPGPGGLAALSHKAPPAGGVLGAATGIQGGGLGALGGTRTTALAERAIPAHTGHTLAGLQSPSSGTALRELAARAEIKQQQRARVRKGPAPAQVTAGALLDAFREQPKAAGVAAHLAPGGALRALCDTAQRGPGLPIGQAAQHYLASRGSSRVWNAVATFNTLVKEGHFPRFSFGSWLKKNVSDHASHALHAVSQTVNRATSTVADVAGAARQGISSFTNNAVDMGRRAAAQVGGAVARGASVGRGVASVGRGALHAAENVGRSTLGVVRHAGHALAHVAAGGIHAAQGAASWAQRKAGDAADWAHHKAQGTGHWVGEKVHSGLEWARKTGVVGAVGTGLRKGLSTLKTVAEHTPLGYAVKKGYGFVKAGGLGKIWSSTKHAASAAWGGLKSAYKTTSKFLQSPAGQLLVTGLSLAASFIPGGIVVKAVIGAGIGAMQAISEGKDWKSVLASAAGGALTGAIPFLKIGPLAKLGVGALQGGITALASGGSLKDVLKGAAGSALDAFDPGAFYALKRLKRFTAAEKLLVKNPGARKMIGALEKSGSKGIKGGIWVSGKAARAQQVLDKVVGAGDKVHGVLSEVHELAPSLADVLGDNAAGHYVGRIGDWAGQGDDRLQKALGYGHAASDTLSKYRGYLDKGLGYAGVKDPAKAYEKMMARRDLRAGKKGALEHVAQLKLEDHRGKHPELHLAEATRTRRHKVQRVAQGVHDGLGKAIAAARHLGVGIEAAQDFNRKVGAPEKPTYLEGGRPQRKKSPHEIAPARAKEPAQPQESSEARSARLGYARAQRKIEELLHKGQAKAASIELMGLGSRCEEISRSIREAKTLAKGNDQYEKEIAFYEDWHGKTAAKLHAAIADTKDLGGQVAISGFGVQESTHPDIFENTRAIYAVRTKVESFSAALHDPAAADQVKKLLAEARQAKAGLQALKARYRKDKAAHEFLTGGGMQDKLIDEALRKLEAPGAKDGAPQHALQAIEKHKKKAIKTHGLNKAIGAGKKVDSGLEKISSVAEQVSRILGEKKFLDQGHQIFHQGLEAAQGHHAKEIEKVHGKEPSHAAHSESALERAVHEGEHLGHDAGTLWKEGKRAVHGAASLRDHLKAHDWKGAWRTGEHVYAEGKRFVHDVREAVHGGWEFVKGLFGGGAPGAPHADPAQTVQNALQWVTAFGQQVTAAVRQIERLMHAGRTKEASDRVQALRAMSDQTRAEVDRAVQAAANDPALAKQAASARKHYREIRAHLVQFIKGLHGLDVGGEEAPPRAHDHAPSGRRRRGQHDPVGDLIDGILDGGDGRIHVDRGAARGDVAVADLQDVDPAAPETWLGSGEGVKLFSEVFGAFIPAERGVVVHHRGGFFARVFERLEGFADRVGGWAKRGSKLLGKGMHYAETGMHGLSQVEGAAEKVQGYAGEAEGFLEKMGLHTLAGYAGKIGGAAGWVDDEAKAAHGGLKKADHWMGEGKSALGKFGALVNLFKSAKTGDGVEGRLSPEKVALGSMLDEPRRLDVTTLSKMQSFLGGDFSGVRVHTGPGAAEVTRRFNAEAVTVKDHIFFAPGRFSPATVEGQKLIAHELTHVLQKGRANLDVRTAEGEALHSEHTYAQGPRMETLNLRRPEPGFRIATDGEGGGASAGIHTAKRTRSRGHEAGGKDELPDGDEFLEQISGRVYDLLMEELEHAFESR